MKKIILILILVGLAFGLKAQERSYQLTPDRTYYKFTGEASDTIGSGNTDYKFELNINKARPVMYNIYVKLELNDDISATYEKDVVLQGKVHDDDSWTDIDENADLACSGSEGDTKTHTFTQPLESVMDTTGTDAVNTAVAPFYRYYQVFIRDGSTVTGLDVGETLKVSEISFKLYER